ncbi:MAG: hypothetical protein M3Q75_09865 [Gemmatimonadota bacterium]|nr:hypothetical protein [Gemmatimonadota bacterium]
MATIGLVLAVAQHAARPVRRLVSLLGALDEPSTLLRWFPALSFPQGTDQLPATTGKGWPATR